MLKVPKNANIAAFNAEDAAILSPAGITTWDFWKTLLIAPFDKIKFDLAMVIITAILVFLGAMINGWVMIAARAAAIVAYTEGLYIKLVILALISAGTFYVCSLWTYEPMLPNIIHPEIAFSMIVTRRIGFVVAVGYLGFATLGFMTGGFAARNVGLGFVPTVTLPIVNQATSNLSYVLYWLGGTFIVFNYVFNYWFRQQKEDRATPNKNLHHSHMRGAKAAAITIFLLTIAFSTSTPQANVTIPPGPGNPTYSPLNGLYTFFSGQFFSGWLIDSGAIPPPAPGSFGFMQAPYMYFVALFAVPGTVILIVLVLLLANSLGNMATPQYTSVGGGNKKDEEEAVVNLEPNNAKISRRLVNRQVQVNYQ